MVDEHEVIEVCCAALEPGGDVDPWFCEREAGHSGLHESTDLFPKRKLRWEWTAA